MVPVVKPVGLDLSPVLLNVLVLQNNKKIKIIGYSLSIGTSYPSLSKGTPSEQLWSGFKEL